MLDSAVLGLSSKRVGSCDCFLLSWILLVWGSVNGWGRGKVTKLSANTVLCMFGGNRLWNLFCSVVDEQCGGKKERGPAFAQRSFWLV